MKKRKLFGQSRLEWIIKKRDTAQAWAEAAYEFEHLNAPGRLNALLRSGVPVPKFITAMIAGKTLSHRGKGKAHAHQPLQRFSLLRATYESDKAVGNEPELKNLDEVIELVASEFGMSFDTLKNKTKKKVPEYNAYIERVRNAILIE